MRREIPLFITFIIGTMLVIAMFIPKSPFPELESEFSKWFDIIAVFGFVLGAGNLLQTHFERIEKKHKDRYYSMVTIAGFLLTLGIGLAKIGNPGLAGNYQGEGTWFKTIYDAIFTPLTSTMFSLLAFYVASASYRAFRAKTKEATVLLLAAFIILVGRTPVGYYLTSWLIGTPFEFLHIPTLATWILSTPNLAGQRAVMIGIALGIIATSLKLILGLERGYIGSEK